MSFSLGTLTAWVDQNPDRFYTNAVLGARTAQLIKDKGILMAGVKNAKTINLIDTDSVFQDDSCGWNSSGTTTLTQRTVTVGKVKIQEALCIKSLEDYFTSQALAMGSMYESESDLFTALAEKFFEKKLGLTAQQVEIALWQGDTAVVDTLEYRGGIAKKEQARFRAYSSAEHSLQDYVNFIKQNPRYQEAVNASADTKAYFEQLQAAGYATDPAYAQKIMAVYQSPALQNARSDDSDTKEITHAAE